MTFVLFNQTLFICVLLVTQSLAECIGKVDCNLAESQKRYVKFYFHKFEYKLLWNFVCRSSLLHSFANCEDNSDSEVSEGALSRDVRSIIPVMLHGFLHPFLSKTLVTIGKITIPLIVYYFNIILLKTIMQLKDRYNATSEPDPIAKYRIFFDKIYAFLNPFLMCLPILKLNIYY